MSDREYYWELGDDYDCDTCGTTWNHAELSIDADDHTWLLTVNVGCYGGASATTVPELESVFVVLRTFDSWYVKTEGMILTEVENADLRHAKLFYASKEQE